MKKLAAIVLLILFLFHLVGYRGWFYLLEQQWQQQVELAFDNNFYNEADLITIRAPLMLPYVTDTKDFQRTDGQITVNGKVYRYVKSKVQNGEYVLLCLPDHYQQKLEKAKQDFLNYSTDATADDGSGKKSNTKPPILKLLTESDQNYFDLQLQHVRKITKSYHSSEAADLAFAAHISPEQPPDFSCI